MSNYLSQALANCEETLLNQSENQAQWQLICRKIGNILQSMGWFEEALIWHSRLLESQHNLGEIYKDLALLYTRLEQWEEAIISYEKILQFNPEHLESYLNLSKIYAHLGNKEQENECLFQIIKIQPEKFKPEAYYKLGKNFQDLGKNERAVTCYLRSIHLLPQFINAYYDLAEIYTLEGQWEKAIEIYHQLLNQDEKQPIAYYNIGKLWWEQEKYSAAINYLSQAAFFEPKLAESYLNFAMILTQKDKLDDLITLCRFLISAKIVYPWTYIQFANALVKKGQINDASLCYQQAAKLRGWTDCVSKNYQFTKDFFNYKIPLLQKYLKEFINQPLINALELGCYEGMSTCWLLDNVLTEATAKLTCVDPKFSDLFKLNLAKTGVKDKVTQLEGYPVQILGKLTANSFDLINLQDTAKGVLRVEKNAENAWRLSKKGGLIIFNDYLTQPRENSEKVTPKEVIDAFLMSKKDDVEIIYQEQQLIIRKSN